MHQLQRVTLIKPWEVRSVWPVVEAELARVLVDSYHQSTDEWMRACAEDRAQLWMGEKFSALTEVREGEPRILHVTALAGEGMAEWLDDLVAAWRSFAAEVGCKMMVATGRLGWKREFKRHGFTVTRIVGVCEV